MFEQIRSNQRRSAALVVFMAALLLATGWVLKTFAAPLVKLQVSTTATNTDSASRSIGEADEAPRDMRPSYVIFRCKQTYLQM